MKSNTHLVSAALSGIPITLALTHAGIITTYPILHLFMLVYIISSIMPDIDHEYSVISNGPLKIIAKRFYSKGHREGTHRLPAIFIYGLILSLIPLLLWNERLVVIPIAGMLGYFLHLLFDGMTVAGIKNFTKNYNLHLLPKEKRFYVGSDRENQLLLTMFITLNLTIFCVLTFKIYPELVF